MDSNQADSEVRKVVAALKDRRQSLSISLYRLAELTNLSREALRLIENGDRNPTLHSLILIASALDTDLGEIISSSAG